jgi:septum site-determining protein MinC
MSSGCFKIKSNRLTLTILELHRYHPVDFIKQLTDTVSAAPKFYEQNPVLIGLEMLAGPDSTPDLAAMLADCKSAGVQVMGFRGANAFRPLVNAAGSALILAGASAREQDEDETPARMQPKPNMTMHVEPPSGEQSEADGIARPGKLILQPVRSGQQIYAEGGDLVVMGTVSGGAELMADGHIHVYGPMNGRALAGIKGDTSARIFCQHMQAELLSVAGVFQTSEDLRASAWGHGVQAFLEDGVLRLAAL